MLNNKDKGIVMQIIVHCNRIIGKVSKTNKNSFINDLDLIEIVCFNIFQIGELAKKLSEDFLATYNKIPWKYVKGMRDKIGHGYDTINIDVVWDTAKESVAELLDYCNYIMEENK